MKLLKKSILNKLSYVILLVLLSVGKMYSQGSLPQGKNQLNIGLGLSEYGAPIYLGFDHGASRDFTLGAEVSFRGYRENWHKVYYRHNITTISGNANYHFNRILNIARKWDLYGGLNVGFTLWSSPNGYDGTPSSGLGIGAQIGTRYYLNNKIGLNLEFGNGSAFYGGKFGLTFKL